jgi:hypothetical protein
MDESIKAELLGNTNLPCIHKHLSGFETPYLLEKLVAVLQMVHKNE